MAISTECDAPGTPLGLVALTGSLVGVALTLTGRARAEVEFVADDAAFLWSDTLAGTNTNRVPAGGSVRLPVRVGGTTWYFKQDPSYVAATLRAQVVG